MIILYFSTVARCSSIWTHARDAICRYVFRKIAYALRVFEDISFSTDLLRIVAKTHGKQDKDAREKPTPDETNVTFLPKRVGSQFALLFCLGSLGRPPIVDGGSTVQNDLMNGIFHSDSLIIPGTYFLPLAIYFRN